MFCGFTERFVWFAPILSYITRQPYWKSTACYCNHIIDYCNQMIAWSNEPCFYWKCSTSTKNRKLENGSLTTSSLFPFAPSRFDFLLWCMCGACHTPTPQQRRLLLASSSASSVSKSSRAATLPVPALTPTRSPAPLTWWRWPSLRPSRLTCHPATAPTAASTAGHTWPTTTSSSQRYDSSTSPTLIHS